MIVTLHILALSQMKDSLSHSAAPPQAPFWPEALTTMGRLFPYAKGRAGAGALAIVHFKEAAKADVSSSLVWEMLGEMLAPGDPQGERRLHICHLALSAGHCLQGVSCIITIGAFGQALSQRKANVSLFLIAHSEQMTFLAPSLSGTEQARFG